MASRGRSACGRLGLVALALAALALTLGLGADQAQALKVKTRAETAILFRGEACGDRDILRLRIPKEARRPIRILKPRRGKVLHDQWVGGRVAVIDRVRRRGRFVVLSAWADPQSIACTDPDVIDGLGWQTEMLDAVISYFAKVRLQKRQAKRFAHRILERKFGAAYAHGNGRKLSCSKRLGSVRVRCKASWRLGDSSYSGRITVRLRKARRGKVRFAYSMRVKLLDDYCLAIGGTRASCTRIYKAEG